MPRSSLFALALLPMNAGCLLGEVPGVTRVDEDGDGYLVEEDCDDHDAAVNPSVWELCNEIDDDCNGEIDDAVIAGAYADVDGDGFGDPSQPYAGCTPPAGYVADATDCDDSNAAIGPRADEICDGLDNDCDGTVDIGAIDAPTGYADADGDGYGATDGAIASCDQTGLAATGTDCDDSRADVHPDASEACDEVDNDCDNVVDEVEDQRGWADADGDGFGDPALMLEGCDVPSDYVNNDGDCNDEASGINPAADERCDLLDNDCDGLIDEIDAIDKTTWYLDADGDAFGSDTSVNQCNAPAGYVENSDDCRDSSASTYPGAAEVCDAIDNDCDGASDEDAIDMGDYYADADSDGFGTPLTPTTACTAPDGFVNNALDCDDADATTVNCDSCLETLHNGLSIGDGLYTIRPATTDYAVYCSMSWDGGGWTLIAMNAWGGTWTEDLIDSGAPFGTIGLDYNGLGFAQVTFTDVLFSNTVMYAQYDAVSDGSAPWLDFQTRIPAQNCGVDDGYGYPMTDGNLAGTNLCDTNLYVNVIDLDGDSVCANGDDEEAHGPAWSTYRDIGCPLDDPAFSSFINNDYGQLPFGSDTPLYFWVR